MAEKKPCSQVNAQTQHTSDYALPSCSNVATSSEARIQGRWRPAYLSQVDMVQGFSSPRRAKRHFLMAMSRVHDLKKKVIHLNRRNAKLLKRIRLLEDLLNHLKKKKLITDEAEANIMV